MKYLHHFKTNDEFHANYDMNAESTEEITKQFKIMADIMGTGTAQEYTFNYVKMIPMVDSEAPYEGKVYVYETMIEMNEETETLYVITWQPQPLMGLTTEEEFNALETEASGLYTSEQEIVDYIAARLKGCQPLSQPPLPSSIGISIQPNAEITEIGEETVSLIGYYEPWASYTDENTTQTEITGIKLEGLDGTYRYAGEYMFSFSYQSGTFAHGYAPLWTNGTDYVYIFITTTESGGEGGGSEPIFAAASQGSSTVTYSGYLVPTSDLDNSVVDYARKTSLVNRNNTLYIGSETGFTPNLTDWTTAETTKNMAYNKFKDRIFVTYDGTNQPVVDSATSDIKHAAIYVNNVYHGVMNENMSITLSDGTEMDFGINVETGELLAIVESGGGGVS